MYRFVFFVALSLVLTIASAKAQVNIVESEKARDEQIQVSEIYKYLFAKEEETLKHKIILWNEQKPDFSEFVEIYGVPTSLDCKWDGSETCKIIWTQQDIAKAARLEAMKAFKTSPKLWRTSMGPAVHSLHIIGIFEVTGELLSVSPVLETSS